MSKLDQVRALREAKFVKAPKPKAAVRKPVKRGSMEDMRARRKRSRLAVAKYIVGNAALDDLPAIPIEPCPNCNGTGKRPRSMTAAERQRLRRARLKGGK